MRRGQKYVESLQGGEKPAVVLQGHYHKFNVGYPREVWVCDTGTCCFTGNTRVAVPGGCRKISHVAVGDEVITAENRIRKVAKVHKRKHSGDLVKVNYGRKGDFRCQITATPEHPVLSFSRGEKCWKAIEDLTTHDEVYVQSTACVQCGSMIPFYMNVCESCNPMHLDSVRRKLSDTRGGFKKKRVGNGSGHTHLIRDIVPFCERMKAEGWSMVPVGASVIPDAIGFKDGEIVAFELEHLRGLALEYKQTKYADAAIAPFIHRVQWVDLNTPKRQSRSHYIVDASTPGFVRVSVLNVTRKPTKWGRGNAVTVYNLEVEEDHTYIASKVAVHNCDQTLFMRKKQLQAHVGGSIIELMQAPDGRIVRFRCEFLPFYDRGFYEDQRRKFGLPSKLKRAA